jgi:nucleoside-diphosphate-sugar epimerase
MRVLVTGSNGYIGRVLVPALQRAGHLVLGYDAGWFGRESEAPMQVIGDIRDTLVYPDWPEVVVHLAGLSNDPMGDMDKALTYGVNLWGTVDMLTHHSDAKHVVVSSCAVYGQATELCDETTPPNPQTTYAVCKARVDDWLDRRITAEYTILRLGTVYGWSPNHRLDLVVNRMVYDALNLRRVKATGNAARPITHIEDVASAIVWAVESPASRQTYNIVGENVRMRDLALEVAHVAAVPVVHEDGGADTRDYMASGTKALRAGWHPTRTVRASLPRLFEKSNGLDHWDLDAGIRINTLRQLIDAGELDPKTLIRRAA